jgi:hypothetical protein
MSPTIFSNQPVPHRYCNPVVQDIILIYEIVLLVPLDDILKVTMISFPPVLYLNPRNFL